MNECRGFAAVINQAISLPAMMYVIVVQEIITRAHIQTDINLGRLLRV